MGFDAESIAVLEIASIARGVVVLDQMAKRAATTTLVARTISPGRYLIVFEGHLAEVEEAWCRGTETAAEDLVDRCFLRDPHHHVRDALASRGSTALDEALAIVETATVSSALWAAERCAKETSANILELRLGSGIGGKGLFSMTGALHLIEAATQIARDAVGEPRLVRVELIAQPHPDTRAHLEVGGHLLAPEPASVRGARQT